MIFYNVPGGGRTVDSAYAANEEKEGGRYPIGKNKCWHSGVHINTEKKDIETAIKPIIGGELAAYRISAEYERAPLRKEISAKAYSKLNNLTRSLYRNEANNEKHTLWKEELTEEEESWLKEKITPDEYNELPAEMRFFYKERELITEIREMYKWDSNKFKYILLKKIAANFILLRHEIPLPSSEEKIRFYTLYMGIMPGVPNALKKYLNRQEDFMNDESRPLSIELPFYRTWNFTLTGPNPLHHYYKTLSGEKKLIKGSHCSFTEKSKDNFLCKFNNAGGEEIEMPADRIKITSRLREREYEPIKDRRPVYKILGQQVLPFVMAELRMIREGKTSEVYFYGHIKDFDKDHFEVMIDPDEVYRDLTPENDYKWWCKGVRSDQRGVITYEDPISVFYKNNDAASVLDNYKIVDFSDFLKMAPEGIERQEQLCGVIKYDPEKIEMEYSNDKKIVSVRKKDGNSEKNEYKNEIVIPLNLPPVVIVKNPESEGIISFLYSDLFRTMNIGCYEPPAESGTYTRSDTYPVLTKNGKTDAIVRKLTVSHLLPLYELARGEELNVNVPNSGTDSLPEEFVNHESLRPCRLACGEEDYIVLVKKDDLKIKGEARGVLEKIDEVWNGGLTLCSERGAVIYDGPEVGSNARDIMPTSREEFEITNPASLYRENEKSELKYKNETTKYVNFQGCVLKAGIFFKKGYGCKESNEESDNEIKVVKEQHSITRNEILGYPNPHSQWNDRSFYDLACFFTDKKFIKEEINNEAGMRYIIQQETELYELKENTGKKGFFNSGTVFLCEETGEGENRVYKLTIKTINAYMMFNGRTDRTEWETECSRLKRENKNYEIKEKDIKLIKGIILWDKHVGMGGNIITYEKAKWLEEKLINAWGNLQEGNFSFIEWADGGNPRYNIEFSTAAGYGAYLGAIWVKPSDIDARVERKEENGNTVLEIKQNVEISYYEENPYSFRLLNGGERPKIDGYCRKVSETSDGDKNRYIQIQTDTGEKYYVPSDTDGKPEKMEETNLFNWGEHFIVEESDNNGDLFCESADKILKAVADKDANIDVEKLFEEKDREGKITIEEFLKAYKNDADYKPVARGLRKLICRHPLEWDAALYKEDEFSDKLNMPEDRFKNLETEMKLLDIWKGDKGIKEAVEGSGSNNFWFAHPVYFINHLSDAGLLDKTFNPYEGKYIEGCWQEIPNDSYPKTMITVVDTPGFAPLGSTYEYEDKKYAYVSGLYGQKYKGRQTGEPYNHEGVDFGGNKEEVVSLIHAEVLACGIQKNTYGRSAVFADLNNKGIYLIAHLSEFVDLKVGKTVSPGECVAKTGGSGWDTKEIKEDMWDPHLHVSYYDIKYSGKSDDYISPEDDEHFAMKALLNKENANDPFKHSNGYDYVIYSYELLRSDT